jgi:hypothetical protein
MRKAPRIARVALAERETAPTGAAPREASSISARTTSDNRRSRFIHPL